MIKYSSQILPIHSSSRNTTYRKPHKMDSLKMTGQEREEISRIANSIFTSCANVGLSFQETIMSIYLSGLEHGTHITKE